MFAKYKYSTRTHVDQVKSTEIKRIIMISLQVIFFGATRRDARERDKKKLTIDGVKDKLKLSHPVFGFTFIKFEYDYVSNFYSNETHKMPNDIMN